MRDYFADFPMLKLIPLYEAFNLNPKYSFMPSHYVCVQDFSLSPPSLPLKEEFSLYPLPALNPGLSSAQLKPSSTVDRRGKCCVVVTRLVFNL